MAGFGENYKVCFVTIRTGSRMRCTGGCPAQRTSPACGWSWSVITTLIRTERPALWETTWVRQHWLSDSFKFVFVFFPLDVTSDELTGSFSFCLLNLCLNILTKFNPPVALKLHISVSTWQQKSTRSSIQWTDVTMRDKCVYSMSWAHFIQPVLDKQIKKDWPWKSSLSRTYVLPFHLLYEEEDDPLCLVFFPF